MSSRRGSRPGSPPGPGAAPGPDPAPASGLRSGLLVVAGVALVHLLVLVAVHTPSPHPGGDNAAYLSLASSLVHGTGYTELWDPLEPPHAKYPPAWSLLLALAMALGASGWVAFKALAAGLVLLAGMGVAIWAAGRWDPGHPDGPRGTSPAARWAAGGGVALLAVLSAGWVEASRWILSEPLFLVGVFLALVGADRAGLWLARHPVRGAPAGAGGWIALAALGTFLALFTRTAGLPLFLGLLVLLAWNLRWRALGAVAGVAVLPVTWWILRGRGAGEGAYQDEFWMVNPYDPALGMVGIPELLGRAWVNLNFYAGRVLGAEWWGSVAPAGGIQALGILLLALALGGWGLRLARREAGLAELFLPLYGGLVLLWPQVWSGDRFVLPLYPLLLFWAAELLARGWARLPASPGAVPAGRGRRGRGTAREKGGRPLAAGWVLAGMGVLLLAGPAVVGIQARAETASLCRSLTSEAGGDPFACHGDAFRTFRDAAAWSGVNLPEGAVVLNRKPRIFFALGGTPGRVFPFERDAEPLLTQADALGARYLLLDQVDAVSLRFLPAIVGSWPTAFCWLQDWDETTALLGILPPEARGRRGGEGEETFMEDCDPDDAWTREGGEAAPPPWDARVPVVIRPPSPRLR